MENLYPHQRSLLDRNPARHLIAFSTGTGKTLTCIALAERNCGTCLVIVPKGILLAWKRAIPVSSRTVFIIITKEQFKAQVSTLEPFDGVIVDEGHYFAGIKSQLSKSLYWYFKKYNTQYRWIATATPYLSTPLNIYTLARLLGHEINYMKFKYEYFNEVRMGQRVVPVIRPDIQDKLRQLVLQIGSTLDMEEIVEVPEQIFETEEFDITPQQKDAIDKIDASEFITRWTKTHCIENGVLYSDGYTQTEVYPCGKTDRIISLVEQHKKVAIVSRYTAQIAHLKSIIISQCPDKSVFVIDGSSNAQERDAIITGANTSDNAVVLIQASCSAGYELPSFGLIIFASLSFSYVDYQQVIGRFLRINKLKENRYIHMITRGVDKDVYNCIINKQDFSFAIYGKSTSSTSS